MNMPSSSIITPASSSKPVASSAPSSFPPFFRRRPMGRAPSPPMWACYEQIQPQYSDDSEDDNSSSDSEENSHSASDEEDDDDEDDGRPPSVSPQHMGGEHMEMEMDVAPVETSNDKMEVEQTGSNDTVECGEDNECGVPNVKKDKGKQRAVDPPAEVTAPSEYNVAGKIVTSKKRCHHRQKKQEASFTFRPILTIRKSDGFVWNQDLFVPTYAKDRYLFSDIASTSPPSSDDPYSFTPVPANEFNDNYEIDVVEIRVKGNELEKFLS